MSSDPIPSERPLGRVAVLGLGVMGGSIARAITGLGVAERVTGWAPESTERDAALTARAITFAAAEWESAVADADLVVVAVPLRATVQLLEAMPEHIGEDAVVTDVASLKVPVAEAVERRGLAGRWVGSHPMAGSESSGFWASRSDLFEGARVWTVAGGASEHSVQATRRLWTTVGARPRRIEAADHDRLMALASHLPQLSANALAVVLEQAGIAPGQLGPGGTDATRLAGSSPDMWVDLLEHASPTLIGGLRSMGYTLERLAELLERGDLDAVDRLMRQTRTWKGSR